MLLTDGGLVEANPMDNHLSVFSNLTQIFLHIFWFVLVFDGGGCVLIFVAGLFFVLFLRWQELVVLFINCLRVSTFFKR